MKITKIPPVEVDYQVTFKESELKALLAFIYGAGSWYGTEGGAAAKEFYFMLVDGDTKLRPNWAAEKAK